jgi:hypothetical protein
MVKGITLSNRPVGRGRLRLRSEFRESNGKVGTLKRVLARERKKEYEEVILCAFSNTNTIRADQYDFVMWDHLNFPIMDAGRAYLDGTGTMWVPEVTLNREGCITACPSVFHDNIELRPDQKKVIDGQLCVKQHPTTYSTIATIGGVRYVIELLDSDSDSDSDTD